MIQVKGRLIIQSMVKMFRKGKCNDVTTEIFLQTIGGVFEFRYVFYRFFARMRQ